MPKKFVGENSKAVAARARKVASKEADNAKKQKDEEDAYWKDENKQTLKKAHKKMIERKAEAKALLEKEMDSIKPATKQPASKITRAQIVTETDKRNSAAVNTTKPNKPKTHIDEPLEENINHFQPEEVANTIDEAIAMLSASDINTGDKHPEKRLKAAYQAFELKELPRLKEENPTLRMSQLKQMLFKDWSKSSENPLNNFN
ncbi:uncharacterized protein CBL_13679 [Carabus blaptoides fortunei]